MTWGEEELRDLGLEYRLTIGFRLNCQCSTYFVRRRDVLLLEVLKAADVRGVDPVDLFATYARGVHARHLANLPILPEVAS